MKKLFSILLFFILTSCVSSVAGTKKSRIFFKPGVDMVPVLVQGRVMGEDIEEKKNNLKYYLREVRVSVKKTSGRSGITIASFSDNNGFFSLSPDYVPREEMKKHSYMVTFKKKGYQSQSRIMMLPSPEASSLNISLKRIK